MARFGIGIDVGGTKIAFGVVRIDPSRGETLGYYSSIPTAQASHESPNTFCQSLVHCVEKCKKHIPEGSKVTLGIGLPGKIENGQILPDTAPQLGPEWNAFPIQKTLFTELSASFPQVSIALFNDALAQLAFSRISSPELWKTHSKAGYLGIGTGLGGAFVELQNNGKTLTPRTDGHVGDLVLEEGKTAERDALSGFFIREKTGLCGKDLAQVIDQPAFKNVPQLLGKNLADILEKLHRGDFQKSRASTQWSTEDREFVSGVDCYFIGGSIGTCEKIGTPLVQFAREELSCRGLSRIQLTQLPSASAQAAIMGCVRLVDELPEQWHMRHNSRLSPELKSSSPWIDESALKDSRLNSDDGQSAS